MSYKRVRVRARVCVCAFCQVWITLMKYSANPRLLFHLVPFVLEGP